MGGAGRHLNHSGGKEPSTLEAQVVRGRDRIAYINHDIDDAAQRHPALNCSENCLRVLGHTHGERISTMIGDIVAASRSARHPRRQDVQIATDALRFFCLTRVPGQVARRRTEV